jgi:glutamate-1-semialdehyde 2,1-aminomutase
LRKLAGRYGFLLIFDEVKTGFRHAFGGYAEVSGVRPDLAVYGKAIASGYPLAAIGGRREFMDYLAHGDPARRVFVAGTYNGHPVPTAAAIATLERLLMNGRQIYQQLEQLGTSLESGLSRAFADIGTPVTVARQGSAFSLYFMDHYPVDWHDIAAHHDSAMDVEMRRQLIARGVYVFPTATKQWSISAAHTNADIDWTVEQITGVVAQLADAGVPARA